MRALLSFDRLFKRLVSCLPILRVALPSPSAFFENVSRSSHEIRKSRRASPARRLFFHRYLL